MQLKIISLTKPGNQKGKMPIMLATYSTNKIIVSETMC